MSGLNPNNDRTGSPRDQPHLSEGFQSGCSGPSMLSILVERRQPHPRESGLFFQVVRACRTSHQHSSRCFRYPSLVFRLFLLVTHFCMTTLQVRL